MTAKELAEALLRNPDCEVTAFDADAGHRQPVSGMVLREEQRIIELHTDLEP